MLSLPRARGSLVLSAAALMACQNLAGAASNPPDSIPTVIGRLTLPRALELTHRYKVALKAADLRAAGAHSRIQDASRAPNPSLLATEENFGGGVDGGHRETTLELQQILELGGDRKARTAAAKAEYRVASAEAAVFRRETLAAAAEQFMAAWALQTRIGRLRQGEQLTRQAVQAAAERYRAGASLMLERTRAESQALAQAVERQRVEAELAVARRNLATQWGATEASFDSLDLPGTDWGGIADADRGIAEHPELERASANQALAAARVEAAEANRVPDLAVSGGVRRLEGSQGTGFVAGVEIPLPLWNRGTGTLGAAQRDREAADAEARAAVQRLRAVTASAVERLRSAAATYDTLRLIVRPARERLVQDLLRAYRAGRLGYLDLIAEQRNLLDTDLALVEAEADLWRARVGLDLLVGGGVLPPGLRKDER